MQPCTDSPHATGNKNYTGNIPEAAAEVAAPEELLGAPVPDVEAPNPDVAVVPAPAVEPKPNMLGAAAEEEEGRGVLTATPNALEVLGAAELAGVEAGKLREKDGVAAGVLVAGEGVTPSDGPVLKHKCHMLLRAYTMW